MTLEQRPEQVRRSPRWPGEEPARHREQPASARALRWELVWITGRSGTGKPDEQRNGGRGEALGFYPE